MSKLASEHQERNPRGIPKAPFIVRLLKLSSLRSNRLYSWVVLQADVAEFLGPDPNPENALKEFQAALAYVHNPHPVRGRDLNDFAGSIVIWIIT